MFIENLIEQVGHILRRFAQLLLWLIIVVGMIRALLYCQLHHRLACQGDGLFL